MRSVRIYVRIVVQRPKTSHWSVVLYLFSFMLWSLLWSSYLCYDHCYDFRIYAMIIATIFVFLCRIGEQFTFFLPGWIFAKICYSKFYFCAKSFGTYGNSSIEWLIKGTNAQFILKHDVLQRQMNWNNDFATFVAIANFRIIVVFLDINILNFDPLNNYFLFKAGLG